MRGLRESEREELLDLLELCFDERSLFESYLDFDPRFEWSDIAVVECDRRLAACVQAFHKRIRLAGSVTRLGGIGSVATHPDYRGRGFAEALVQERERYMAQHATPLGLLFTAIPEFYTRLGWFVLPMRQFEFELRDLPDDPELAFRPFESPDLDAVRALFDTYASRFEGAIVRDARDWSGQLRYAGAPGEDFHVVETNGQIAAYSRCARFDHGNVVMEHAYLPGAARALCQLFAKQLAPGRGLLRLPPDPELEEALHASCSRLARRDDPTPMWRVFDRQALASLGGLPPGANDSEILNVLIAARNAHYWVSDRF